VGFSPQHVYWFYLCDPVLGSTWWYLLRTRRDWHSVTIRFLVLRCDILYVPGKVVILVALISLNYVVEFFPRRVKYW